MKYSHSLTIVALILCIFCSNLPLQAQMTRNQLLRKFYQITTLHNSGRDADAIAVCEEIVSQYPAYPDTYLRMAEIYDSAGDEELALIMYRKYISLEMDDEKIKAPKSRLAEIGNKLGVPDFEEQEQALLKHTVMPDSQSENLDFESIFDISSLVSLADTTTDIRNEIVPFEQLNAAATGLDISGVNAGGLLPEPVIKIPDLNTDFNTITVTSAGSCDVPFRFVEHKEILDAFNAQLKDVDNSFISKEKFQSVTSLQGKWISSLYNDETGQEFLIIDIKGGADGLYLSFDDNCGMFTEYKSNLIKTSWNKIKSMWSTDRGMFDASELIGGINKVNFSEERVSVSCQLSKRDRPNIAAMGKDLIDNISTFIPLGNVVSKIGGSLLNQINKNQGSSSFQTVIDLTFHSVTDNVISCELLVREEQKSTGTSKTVMIDNKTFYMYRVPATYEVFRYIPNGNNYSEYKPLYERLQAESSDNSDLLFPLAMMSYYKVGIADVSDVSAFSKAISQMQQLSDNGCARASAWLIPVYYNLSMDERHYPLRSQRKHFRELSEKLLDEMLEQGYGFAYGLRGDIISGGIDGAEKASESYRIGMSKDDAHSYYRMGLLYMEGTITPRNPEQALQCFRKASEMGYADAGLQLALAYKNGSGVEQNYIEYIRLLGNAIEAGSIDALAELSDAFMWGIGVQRDVNAAVAIRKIYFQKKDNTWIDALAMYGCPITE